jgi:CheY-like chemotaxis protein
MENGPTHRALEIGLMQTDGDGLCRAVSAEVCALLDKNAPALTGQFIFTIFSADVRPAAIAAWERIVATKEAGRFDTAIAGPDGVALPVVAHLSPARGITALTDHWIVVFAPPPLKDNAAESELRYLRTELAETKNHLEAQLNLVKEELAQAHRAKEVLLESVETSSNERLTLMERDRAAAREENSRLESERRNLQESIAKLVQDSAASAARDAAIIAARDESIAHLRREIAAELNPPTPPATSPAPPPATELSAELAKLRAENLILAERVRSAADEIAHLRRSSAALEAEWQAKLTAAIAASATLTTKTTELETDRRALTEACAKNAALESTLHSLRESTTSATTALEAKITATQQQLAQTEARLSAEQQNATDLQHRVTEAEKRSTESSEFAHTASREFKDMLRKHDDVVAVLARAREELGTTQHDLEAERRRAADFTATVRALRAENTTLRQERDAALGEVTRSTQVVTEQTDLMFGTADDFFERIITEVASRLNGILRIVYTLPDLTPASPTFLALGAARTSAEDLVRALDDIRDYWHLETGRISITRDNFALRAWWSSVAARYEFKASQREITFDSRHDPELPDAVLVDGGYLDQSVNQLLDYLIETSAPGDSITCILSVLAVSARDTRLRMELTSSSTVGITGHNHRLSVAVAEKILRLLGGEFTFTEYPGEERRITVELTFLRGSGVPPVAPRPRRRTVREDIEPLPAPLIRRHTPTPVSAATPPLDSQRDAAAAEPVDAGAPNTPPPPSVPHARIIGRAAPRSHPTPPESPRNPLPTEPLEPPAPTPPPLVDPPPLSSSPPPEELTAPPAIKVLVAEDNRMNQRALSEILRTRGFAVTVVADGREALTHLSNARFDLALIDCEMPVMDGYAATREIRAIESRSGRHTPIIAMTVYVDSDIHARCLEAGMDDLITKPVQAEPLLALIDRFIGCL